MAIPLSSQEAGNTEEELMGQGGHPLLLAGLGSDATLMSMTTRSRVATRGPRNSGCLPGHSAERLLLRHDKSPSPRSNTLLKLGAPAQGPRGVCSPTHPHWLGTSCPNQTDLHWVLAARIHGADAEPGPRVRMGRPPGLVERDRAGVETVGSARLRTVS